MCLCALHVCYIAFVCMWLTSVGDVFGCRVCYFAFVNVCGCSPPPHPYSALAWSLPDVLCSGVVWPLVEAPSPLSLSLSLLPSNPFSISLLLFVLLPPCSHPTLSSAVPHYQVSLPPSFNPSSVIPAVFPLLSWQILVIPDNPQGMTGVFQTFPPQACLPRPLSTLKHAAGKYLDDRKL